MAPTPTGGKNPKGKQLKSKVSPGPATPVVRNKRKVNCSKCKTPHFPPTGRACQKLVTSHNLSSTLVQPEEEPHVGTTRTQNPPTLSPVRPDPNALAAQAQVPPLGLINIPGPSTQFASIPPSTPSHNPNSPIQDILNQIFENQQDMKNRQNDLVEKERQRTAREALNMPDSNRNVFSSEQERWEELSNNSMRIGHQLRQAMADDPLGSAAHHPATARDSNQRVNGRLIDLGEEATARQSGAQGV